ALHDSGDSFPQPRCHPETRTEMLDNLWRWSEGMDPADSILWLYGPAGAGKSALMRTFAEQSQDAGCLGGSFFFKRGHASRGNAKMLFATLAYQLALYIAPFKATISQIIQADPSIVGKAMVIQLQKLIMQPFQLVGNFLRPIFIIDGLDECKCKDIQQEILRIIATAVHGATPPFRMIIASRPESYLCDLFRGDHLHGLYRPFNIEQAFEDVAKYFRDEFARIHQEHQGTMEAIPSPWPSPRQMEALVNKSSGYFIYASTVIRFIDDKDFRPVERLAAIENPH
ncbi:hypothetical protein B0H10DRAFT_1796182, partial [Mycena sp. CBHHK59/15]